MRQVSTQAQSELRSILEENERCAAEKKRRSDSLLERATGPTIGIDIGDRYSYFCVLSVNGDIVEQGRFATEREAAAEFFSRHPTSRIVMEVGTHSPWLSRLSTSTGHETLVVDPRRLRLLTENERKRDKRDAQLLAEMGRSAPQLLTLVHHRSEETHRNLQLFRTRDLLVRQRTAAVTAVRSMVKSLGSRLPKSTTDNFAENARAAVPKEMLGAVTPLLKVIELLTQQIDVLEGRIEKLACSPKYRDACELVSQPSGIGTLTALAFILTIEDASRFRSSRNVPAYFGLVPRCKQSGTRDQQLGISKTGDELVRKLLVQCASLMMRPSAAQSDMRTWALGLAERGGKNGKKRATVGLARKLAVLMHRLWVTGEEYQPLGYGKKAA